MTVGLRHFVDFSGNLDETGCGLELDSNVELVDPAAGTITVYMSDVSCPGCKTVVECKAAVQLAGGAFIASSKASRIASSVSPAPRSTLMP